MLQNWYFAQNKENQCKWGQKEKEMGGAITADFEYTFCAGKQKTDHSQVDSCIGWLYFILTKVKPVPKLHDHF